MAVNVNVAGLSPGVYAQAIGFDVGRMVEKTATVTLSVVGRSTALSPPILSNIGNGPQGIATGDFNGDGKLDIAVANQNDNTVSVLLGGGGGFSNAPGSPFAAGNQPYAIATGDFNRDGRLDLAITNVGNNTVTVLLGNGFGGFTPAPGSPFATGNWPTSIAAADLDGDGNVDLVIAYAKDNRIAILRGNGSGGFTPLSTAAPCSSFPYVVTVGDFNGDGMQDLAVGCWGHNTNSAVVLLNDGTAKSFAAHPLNIANWVHSLVAKDINGDGQVDLVIGYNTSTGAAATVALGDGQGGFTFSYGAPPTVYAPDATFVSPPGPLMGISVAVGDLNGDGRLDLALADKANPTGLTVLLGDGTGAGFTPATRGGSSVSSAGALAIADFTGDGTNDIAVANAGSPFIAMLSGGWQSTATTLTTTAPASVAANTPVPLTARVVNSGTYVFTPPTGSVSLMDGANLIQSSSSQNGVAGFNPQLVIVGTHSLTAVFQGGSTNLSSTSNAILETVTPGPPAAFTSPNPPQTTTVGTAFALGLKFTVRDVYGNPIPGITVTFSAPTSGASITGFSQTVVTDAQGLAYSPATANTVAGTYQVIASTGSITGQTTLVNTPGATVNFSVSGPTTTPAGSTVAFTVVAQDGYNNPTPNYSANAQISNSDSKATIPRTVQVANGTGSFQGTFYTAKTQIVLVLVQITPPGGGPAIPQASGSANITVTPLTAQSLLVQVPSGASTAGQAIPVAVCALDGYQNFATSYSGTITISTSDPQTSAPTTVTATNGCTATLFITFKTSGNQLVFAKSPTLPLSSSPVSITPGPPVGITVLGGTPQSTIFSTPFSTLLQGRVMDAFGNPVPSTPVTFTAPVSGAGATFLSNPATTDLNGYFSVTAVANSKFGQYEVVASAGAAPALYTLTNGVGLTLQTSPPGLTLVRDAGAGTPVSTPSTFILLPGTTMTVTAPSPWASNTDPANAQYAFQSWSDGGDRSHSFVVPSQNLTLTANYGQQYRLTATSSLPAAGSVTLPAGTTTATGMYGFFDASSTVSIAATANSGYSFSGWVGPAAIQSNAATTVVMTGPQSVTANFRRLLEAQVSPVFLGLQYVKGTDPAAGHVSVRTNDPSPFSVSSGAAWAVPTPSSATSPASVTVGLNPAALAPGDYSTTLTFRFSDGTAIPVYVQLKVLDVPKLIATPAALNFAAQAGATDVQSQNVILAASSRNVAVQAVATGGDWLTASLAQGNTPVTLRIQVDPSKLGAGTYSGSVAVSSPDAGNSPLQIPVTFNISAQPPTNSISGFVNTASMTPGDSSPNTMMTAFGTFPGCGADTQVLIDGTPTEVYGVGAARIDFLMAGRVSAAQSVQVQVQCGGKSTPPVTVGIRQAAPAVFTTSRSGSGQASVVNEDGSTASPSPRGTTVAVYVTGLGLMGAPAPNGLISTLLPVTASLGGAPVKVAFAGASPGQSAAVQQVNLLIPGDAPIGDAVQLELKVGDVSAQLGVTMAVK